MNSAKKLYYRYYSIIRKLHSDNNQIRAYLYCSKSYIAHYPKLSNRTKTIFNNAKIAFQNYNIDENINFRFVNAVILFAEEYKRELREMKTIGNRKRIIHISTR